MILKLVEILVRLSLDELQYVKCVHKSWLFLISHESFIPYYVPHRSNLPHRKEFIILKTKGGKLNFTCVPSNRSLSSFVNLDILHGSLVFDDLVYFTTQVTLDSFYGCFLII